MEKYIPHDNIWISKANNSVNFFCDWYVVAVYKDLCNSDCKIEHDSTDTSKMKELIKPFMNYAADVPKNKFVIFTADDGRIFYPLGVEPFHNFFTLDNSGEKINFYTEMSRVDNEKSKCLCELQQRHVSLQQKYVSSERSFTVIDSTQTLNKEHENLNILIDPKTGDLYCKISDKHYKKNAKINAMKYMILI